ncbi:MAG TPA: DUF4080 domain-containing protein [Flavobacteriales bacterium]|nr:DUF4080 domain-containing protein [Flavobacteriales bacterium]
MKVLITTLNAKYIHLNLAVRLLYGLNRHRGNVKFREYTIKEDKDEIAGQCQNYDVIAFSCYIWNIAQTLEVCKKIKERNATIKILLGGPEVSYEWEKVIALDYVDYIITGEGEIPFAAFLDHYPAVEHLPNLVSKKNGVVKHTAVTQNFDLLRYENFMPYAWDGPELATKVAYIETSRGCPYKCEFCLASLDNKVRYLPMKTIEENLLYLMQNGKVIKFLDRTFNIKKDFTLHIFNFILENHRPGNIFQFEITADILHPDIITFIDEKIPPGLFRFEIGIQTVNQKANLEVSRKQNFEKTKKIIEQVAHKVELHLDLIVGLPLDYWDDIKHSFEEVFKLHASELQLGFLKFLKGTPVREKYGQYGFVYDPNPPYQLIRSNFLSEEELLKITQLEHALEIYWNKKRAIHALKYVTVQYGSFDFLLGLGIYFGNKRPYHQYSLQDVFDILNEYVEWNYSHDVILKQLVAIDYYLQFKVRPKPFPDAEMDKALQNRFIEKLGLNHHKYRFLVFGLDFDFRSLIPLDEGEKKMVVIAYDGVNAARVFTVNEIPEGYKLKSLITA